MRALLVLTLALVVNASEKTNDTSADEKLVIARGKLLVSTDGSMFNMDNIKISSRYIIMSMKCERFCDIRAETQAL